jgi:hypothetical protein
MPHPVYTSSPAATTSDQKLRGWSTHSLHARKSMALYTDRRRFPRPNALTYDSSNICPHVNMHRGFKVQTKLDCGYIFFTQVQDGIRRHTHEREKIGTLTTPGHPRSTSPQLSPQLQSSKKSMSSKAIPLSARSCRTVIYVQHTLCTVIYVQHTLCTVIYLQHTL